MKSLPSTALVWYFLIPALTIACQDVPTKNFRHTNYSVAQRELDAPTLELYKHELQQYYTEGDYEQEVADICSKAAHHFSTIVPTATSLVIFDVDDTAIYHFHRKKRFSFIWSSYKKFTYMRNTLEGLAIKPVLNLYNGLQKAGFIIIFLTARNDKAFDLTYHELISAGYSDFEQLILMPHEHFINTRRALLPYPTSGSWKLAMRKKLSQTYTIVGTVGDREHDFTGGYTGFEVKLPNYLY